MPPKKRTSKPDPVFIEEVGDLIKKMMDNQKELESVQKKYKKLKSKPAPALPVGKLPALVMKKNGKKVTMVNADEPVFTWALKSSKPRLGGAHIVYEVRLKENGDVTCNCPGWAFKRPGKARGCKHTHIVGSEAEEIYKKYKKGEMLPVLDTEPDVVKKASLSSTLEAAKSKEDGHYKFGRVISID